MSLNLKCVSCSQQIIGSFKKIHFANLYLLIGMLSLFTSNVITDKVGFMSTVLLFVFYSFLFLIFSITSFVLCKYFLVYHFNSLSFTIYFIFIVVALGIIINVLIYNNLFWVNTNLISILWEFCFYMFHFILPPLCCYSCRNDIFICCVPIHQIYTYALCVIF